MLNVSHFVITGTLCWYQGSALLFDPAELGPRTVREGPTALTMTCTAGQCLRGHGLFSGLSRTLGPTVSAVSYQFQTFYGTFS